MTGGWALGWAWQQSLGRWGARACAGRAGVRRALACSMAAQQAQAALEWGTGSAGRAAGRARAEACEARAERSGRVGSGGARGGQLGVPVSTWAC